MLGPTVTGYNSRIEITGGASGAPGLAVVGAGASPATNGSLTIQALGTGIVQISSPTTVGGALTAASYKVGSTAGVSCSGAPTASYAVTNGIVTHC
jgi:hypothetical protein